MGPEPGDGSAAAPSRPPRRPDLARWLWYAVGGRLPVEYREWVLYDVTCRAWPLRHLFRLLGVIVGSVVGLLYSFVFLYEATEQRASKAGYPHGTAARVREERRTARSLAKAAAEFDRRHRRS